MKLSIVSTVLWWLFVAALHATTVHSNKGAGDVAGVADVPIESHLFFRMAHITLANVGSDRLSVDEARFLESSVVTAYESLLVNMETVHMVDAQVLTKSKEAEIKPSGIRGLTTTIRKKRVSASEAFIQKYSKTYRYDYKLFFDPSRCNCGDFWDRHLSSTSYSFNKLQGSHIATKLCQILRNGVHDVFKQVRLCQIVPFHMK